MPRLMTMRSVLKTAKPLGRRLGKGGFGQKILQARLDSKRTQQEVADLTGLAVSYLSRLENNRMTPSIRTLTKISDALGIPVTSFLDSRLILRSAGRSGVDSPGRSIPDQGHPRVRRREQKTMVPAEGYSTRELEILRTCHFLLHHGDKRIVASFSALVKSLVALSRSIGKARSHLLERA